MSRTERQPGRQQRARQNGESRQMLLIVGGVALVILLAVLLTVVIFFNKNRPGDGQGDNSGSGDVSGSVVEERTTTKTNIRWMWKSTPPPFCR